MVKAFQQDGDLFNNSIVEGEQVSFTGFECDKVGTSYKGF
jgi:hypothetical protein